MSPPKLARASSAKPFVLPHPAVLALGGLSILLLIGALCWITYDNVHTERILMKPEPKPLVAELASLEPMPGKSHSHRRRPLN